MGKCAKNKCWDDVLKLRAPSCCSGHAQRIWTSGCPSNCAPASPVPPATRCAAQSRILHPSTQQERSQQEKEATASEACAQTTAHPLFAGVVSGLDGQGAVT